MTQGINLTSGRGSLIFFQESIHAFKVQRRGRDPEVVVNNTIQLRTKVFLNTGVLQTNHAATKHFRLKPKLVSCFGKSNRTWWVGTDVNQVGVTRHNCAHNRCEICCATRWVGLVIHDLQTIFLRMSPRTRNSVLGKFGISRQQRDRLRLWILCHCETEKSARPVQFRFRPSWHDLKIVLVVKPFVNSKTEQRQQYHLLFHHYRHGRCY